jgi:hypothetical protein
LPDDPSYPVAIAQMRRFGGIVAIQLDDAAAVHALVERSELLVASTSSSAASTAPSTGGNGGVTRSVWDSPGCRWVLKTPMTWWPTSSAPSRAERRPASAGPGR